MVVARRAVALAAEVTSTIEETTYTVTSTVIETAPAETITEIGEFPVREDPAKLILTLARPLRRDVDLVSPFSVVLYTWLTYQLPA